MPDELVQRLCNLLTIKSLVTLILTVVFAVLTIAGRVTNDYMTVYAVVIAFYFGTQATKEGKHDA